jgi:2-(1,2-epoxy-1,2-dihydrophenyl)acetyl-CoA isomerase
LEADNDHGEQDLMSDEVIERLHTPARPSSVTLRINRTAVKNALRPEDLRVLNQYLMEAQQDPEIKLVFISGTADTFCAGADINYINALAGAELAAFLDMQSEFLLRIITMPKIVVAAVNGTTAGMGNHIAICSDLCVAVPEAVFHFTGASRALPSLLPGALLMPMMIGLKRAKAVYLRGGKITADRAVDLGFCNFTIARDTWDAELDELAVEFAARDASTLAHNKYQLNQGAFQMIGASRLSILAGAASLSSATTIPTGKLP